MDPMMRQKALEKLLDFITGLADELGSEKKEELPMMEGEELEKPEAKVDVVAITGKKPEEKENC